MNYRLNAETCSGSVVSRRCSFCHKLLNNNRVGNMLAGHCPIEDPLTILKDESLFAVLCEPCPAGPVSPAVGNDFGEKTH